MGIFLKRSRVATIAGVCSKQIKTLILEDGFPEPVTVGKSERWVESEVQEWISSKISQRNELLEKKAAINILPSNNWQNERDTNAAAECYVDGGGL